MFRSVVCFMVVAVVLPSAWANIPALSVQPDAGKKAEPAAESRQKIIDEIRADYDKVLDRLQKDDAGAQTRENQQRIRANIEKLLKQRDPDQGANNNQASPNKPRPPMEPKPAPENANPQPQKALEKPQPQPLPPERAKETKPGNPVGNTGNTDRPANTIEGLLKEKKDLQYWGELRPDHRRAMDASAREQFMNRYEELLRPSIATSPRAADAKNRTQVSVCIPDS